MIGARPARRSLLHRHGSLSALFLPGAQADHHRLQRIFVRALVAHEREAALANQFDTALNNMPHGLCMFGARRPSCGRQSPFQRNDAASGRSGASRRDRPRHRLGLRRCRDRFRARAAQMIVSEIEKSQAEGHHHGRSRRRRDRALSWTFQPMAGGGAVVLLEDITERRNAEARISHLARYDELTALPNRLNFRDEIERLLALPHEADADCRRCCSSTSTSSSRSTTRWAIPAAISCCAPWPIACATCCVRKISSRASAATNSWCSSRTSSRTRTPPSSPGESSIA